MLVTYDVLNVASSPTSKIKVAFLEADENSQALSSYMLAYHSIHTSSIRFIYLLLNHPPAPSHDHHITINAHTNSYPSIHPVAM